MEKCLIQNKDSPLCEFAEISHCAITVWQLSWPQPTHIFQSFMFFTAALPPSGHSYDSHPWTLYLNFHPFLSSDFAFPVFSSSFYCSFQSSSRSNCHSFQCWPPTAILLLHLCVFLPHLEYLSSFSSHSNRHFLTTVVSRPLSFCCLPTFHLCLSKIWSQQW